MKNVIFVFGLVALAVGAFIFLSRQRHNDEASRQDALKKAGEAKSVFGEELFVRPHSRRQGNSMARVTVVEWLDPECESCRSMHLVVKKMIAEYSKQVLFVTRYMPYHSGSMYAASVLEEAGELGKFEEALDILFEKQPEWGSHEKPNPELIPSYLAKIGIPKESLSKEIIVPKHESKILTDKADGEKVGVSGTPSFFVNQQAVQELGEAPLRAAIEAELAKTASN